VIPANRIALEEHVTEPVVMVGFGVTAEEAEDYGVKRSGTATLFSVDPAEVNGLYAGELATSNDPGGTCYGDSGGPTFMTFDGVEAVVGITSRGSLDDQGLDEPCGEGLSIAARVDSYAAFIDQFIADNGGEVDPGDGGGAPDDEGGLPDDGGAHPGDGAAQPDPPDPTGDLDAPAADEPDEVPGGRVRGFAAGCATAPGSPGAGPAVLIVLAALAFVQRRRA